MSRGIIVLDSLGVAPHTMRPLRAALETALRPALCVGLALLATACETPGGEPELEWLDSSATFELQVVSPPTGSTVRNGAGLVEVSGRVGVDWLFAADVVIAIDVSNAAYLASGLDVDEDGRVGKTPRWADEGRIGGRSARRWTTDPGDSVARAQLAAARDLARGLASPRSRVGVITYDDAPRVRAHVGPPEVAIDAIDAIRLKESIAGADVVRALRKAADMLGPPLGEGQDRPRVVFLLSSARPTLPTATYWATRAAVTEARRLAGRHISVCAVGFGELLLYPGDEDDEGEKHAAFLEEISETTGCAALTMDSMDATRIDRVPHHFAPRALTVRNVTTGADARALRVLESGAFDAFLPLSPGPNTLQVRAILRDGRFREVTRVVVYEEPEVETDADRRASARILMRLRERNVELGDGEDDAPESP